MNAKLLLAFALMSLLCAICNAQSLSLARAELAGTAMNGWAFFAGGRNNSNTSDNVDVFDPFTNTMLPSFKLTQRRCRLAAVAADDAVFFAGGTEVHLDPTCTRATSRVDVYYKNGTMFQTELSAPRCDIAAVRSGTWTFLLFFEIPLTLLCRKVSILRWWHGQWNIFECYRSVCASLLQRNFDSLSAYTQL